MKIISVLLLLAFIAIVSAKKVSFDGHSVVLVRINCPNQFKKFASIFPREQLDLWSEKFEAKTDMEIRFTKKQMAELAYMYYNKNAVKFSKFQVIIKNLKDNIDSEANHMKVHKEMIEEKMKKLKTKRERDNLKYSDDTWWRSYHTLEENVDYINKLASDYATMVDKEVIGKSVEGRDLVVLRIHAPGAYDSSKPSMYFQSLMHCREWVSLPTTQYTVKQLLSTYNTNSRVKRILDNVNIHYVPIVNPDGFKFTHTNNRMWRKNRKRNPRGSFGVDLNRNWKSGWGGPGSSGSETSDIYRGVAAFSEPETKAVDDYLTRYSKEMKAALDFHSYSQLNLRPWGKLRTPSPDEAPLRALGQKMMDALRAVHGQTYRNIRAAELYQASGLASDDWYENHGLVAYTFELRPSSAWGGGFNLPPAQILPCAQENYPAVLVVAEHIIENSKQNNDEHHDKTLKDLLNQLNVVRPF